MKRVVKPLNESGSFYSEDYKMEYVEFMARQNYESTDKWLYLGADCLNKNYAKIGITMGDLTSRSYSSGAPSYYLFCAFKFRFDITKQEAEQIECDVLSRIEKLYRHEDGSSKRMKHYESGLMSECFNFIEFFSFFIDLHNIILDHYRKDFITVGYEMNDGYHIDCIFNDRQKDSHAVYTSMIMRYD